MALQLEEPPAQMKTEHQEKKKLTQWQRLEQRYFEEAPGALGFFTLAAPVGAFFDTLMGVPAANGAAARTLITLTGIGGMQHMIGKARKRLYHTLGIYEQPESVKLIADTLFGSGVGAALTPAFHQLNELALPFSYHVPIHDSTAVGALVGGITGLVGWLAADSYAHSWRISDTPSRNIKIPGVAYLKRLPTKAKRALAIGATLASFGGTGAYYAQRYLHEGHAHQAQSSHLERMIGD